MQIEPFVMYIFPFDTVLNTIDLQDIWQNVLPRIGITAEQDSFAIKQSLGPGAFWEDRGPNRVTWSGEDELFHGKRIPPGIRWFVFKVKQKAFTNYADITVSQTDDFNSSPFSVPVNLLHGPAGGRGAFQNEITERNRYSYNWPYDFCSLVELGKIESSINFDNNTRPSTSPPVPPHGFTETGPTGGPNESPPGG